MQRLLRRFVRLLAGWAGVYVYNYPKADATATVVLLFDGGTKTIVIKRKKNPFQGQWALPGGFLEVGRETLRQAAKRELLEETSILLPEQRFIPVDERSDPNRDPRGHVVDHGFVVMITDDEKDAVLKQLKAADDAAEAKPMPVAQLLESGAAFDHRELLIRALEVSVRQTP